MMKKSTIITASVVAVALGIGGVAAGVLSMNEFSQLPPVTTAERTEVGSATDQAVKVEGTLEQTAPQSPQSTEELLVYLIEEEKLAHDVYTVLAEQWGGNTFTNILASETTHQEMVLGLLSSFGVTDPRSPEIGVFTNSELQALYDQLISQGMTSQSEAYAIGVLIEQTDIADLSTALATTTDSSIISVLEKLRSASESHLAAFSKKI